jgi:DNA-binding response OmpR family regulator
VFAKSLILIVGNDPYLALDLSSTVEDLDGQVAGPTDDIAEALQLLSSRQISAAIIDWHLPDGDASPLTCWLTERQVPFVIHTNGHLATPDRDRHPEVPILIKPLQPRVVLARLIREMRRNARRRLPTQATALA